MPNSLHLVQIREATQADWPDIYEFFDATMAEGRTYAFPESLSLDEAHGWWMEAPPGQTVVAVEGERILGSAKMGPNRHGRGAHIATGSFLVNSAFQGRGIGRALGEYLIGWAKDGGYRGIQFNAVVETNRPAVHLWQALGFQVIGTVPEAFHHPEDGYVGLHVMYLPLH